MNASLHESDANVTRVGEDGNVYVTLQGRSEMKRCLFVILITLFAVAATDAQEPVLKLEDIVSVSIDPKDSKLNKHDLDLKEVLTILTSYKRATKDEWWAVHHIALNDRTGRVRLSDGREFTWMIRLGGIAKLTDKSGNEINLLKELPEKRDNPADARELPPPHRRFGGTGADSNDRLRPEKRAFLRSFMCK